MWQVGRKAPLCVSPRQRGKYLYHTRRPKKPFAVAMAYPRSALLLHSNCIATDMLCHSNAVAMWKQCSSNVQRRLA